MLILLPPSEGKHSPRRGSPLDLSRLAFPELTAAREAVLSELVRRCAEQPEAMREILGLGPTQGEEIARNAHLREAPTARADAVYTGVLYEALDLPSLDAPARRRATRWLLIASALFGVVRPGDRIPAYRLAGGAGLPDLGGVSRHWSRHLPGVLDAAAADGLVIDLRSTTYVPFWRPRGPRVVTLRVLRDKDGRRSVVSHDNKATKGALVRSLLESGASARTPEALADQVRDLGWQVESTAPGRLDVVVTSV